MRPPPGSENVSPSSGVPTRIVTAAIMLTKPTAAPGASGRTRAAPANEGANGIPAASPTTAAPATASANGVAANSAIVPAADTTKLARTTAGRSTSRPPAGREMTPRKRISPPAIPAVASVDAYLDYAQWFIEEVKPRVG